MSTKIMFWNIQNAWDYTVTSPEEMAANLLVDEGGRLYGRFLENPDDPASWNDAAQALLTGRKTRIDCRQAIDNWRKSPLPDAQAQLTALIALAGQAGKLKRNLAGALKKDQIKAHDSASVIAKSRRDWIIDIIQRIAPHVLIVVEPATTKSQVDFSLQHQTNSLSNIQELTCEAQDVGGVWVAYQLAVSLGTKWACWASPINSTVAWIKNKQVESKNSFFELYTVLWDTRCPIQLTDRGAFLPGNYLERAPYALHFTAPHGEFYLIFTHAVFGNIAERRETLEVLAQDLTKEPFLNHPVIVMGDFNLDYGSAQNRKLYDALNMGASVSNGVKSTFTSNRDAPPGAHTKNAYDQIFIRGIPKILGGGVYDFAEQVFQFGNGHQAKKDPTFKPLEEITKVSDHLPIWCEVDFP